MNITNNMGKPCRFAVHSTMYKFNHITRKMDQVFNEVDYFTTQYTATQHKKMLQEMQVNGGYIEVNIEQIA